LFVQTRIIHAFRKGTAFPCSEIWGKCPPWSLIKKQTKQTNKNTVRKSEDLRVKNICFFIATLNASREHAAVRLRGNFNPTKWMVLERG